MKLKTFEEVGIVVLAVLIVIALIGLLINWYYQKEPELVGPEDAQQDLFNSVEEGNLTKCDELSPAMREVCRRSIIEQSGG
ncbi:MAG: hypothetical protein ABH828_01315 [archaeon]